MHKNSVLLFERFAKNYFSSQSRVLEIGPDDNPSTFRKVINGSVSSWDTLDIAPKKGISHTFRPTAEYSYPIVDNSYDIVLSGQVIEHVPQIWLWMNELARVVKPGGVVITINPVTWHYHGARGDCWRIFPEGMKALCEYAGLGVILSEWNCLEIEKLQGIIPRRIIDRKDILQRFSGICNILYNKLWFPIECSFDTITIASKPERNVGLNR